MTSPKYTVSALGGHGDGIIDVNGETRFVPGAVPGDMVDFDATDKVTALKKGPHHAAPRCSQYGQCGGCSLQHISDDLYADWLKTPILRAFEQHGLTPHILPPIVTPPKTRRRCALKGVWQGKTFSLGFSAQRSHSLVSLADCAVLDELVFGAIAPLEEILKCYVPYKRAVRVNITRARNGLDIALEGIDFDDVNLRQDMASFALEHGQVVRIIGRDRGHEDIICQIEAPLMRFDGGQVALPVDSFTQATPHGERALVDMLKTWVGTPKSIADLFCGIGTFSVPMSAYAKVDAFEGSKAAVDALKGVQLAKGRHGINVHHRDLFRRPVPADDLSRYDVVVIDPPRAGAKAQCDALAQSSCPRVLFVSCNPNTFARDAGILIAGGYMLEAIQPVGQFLWSTHVELAALFTRP